jgi:hypothetical protein
MKGRYKIVHLRVCVVVEKWLSVDTSRWTYEGEAQSYASGESKMSPVCESVNEK